MRQTLFRFDNFKKVLNSFGAIRFPVPREETTNERNKHESLLQ
jgi:hypothetical protein